MKPISELLAIGKIPTKIIVWLFGLAGVLLLLPGSWLETLHLEQFLRQFGQYVGIVFLSSVILLVIRAASWMWDRSVRRKKGWAREEKIQQNIDHLDHAEKGILREFALQGKSTLLLPVDDATVAGLLQKGILKIVSRSGERSLVGTLFPVAMTTIAESYITLEAIGMPGGNLSEGQLRQLRGSRPSFVTELERREWLRSW